MEFKDIMPFARFVRYLTIEENTYFPPYAPIDARLFYVYKGTGAIQVRKQFFSLHEGDLMYINSGVNYRLLPSSVTYLAVNFDFTDHYTHLDTPIPPVDLRETTEFAVLEQAQFADTVCFNDHYLFRECQIFYELLSRLEREFIRKLPFYRQETSALLISVLTRLARAAEQRESKNDRFNIESVVSYIQKHYGEPIDNNSLAQVFHYHPNYLGSEFKRCIGTPLHRYLLETRILKASSLIEAGYENLSEVAAMCGFSDPNYFTRYFKKVIGVPPAKFAKSAKK